MMLSVRRGIGVVSGTIGLVGLALGLVGYAAMRWAQVQFVTAAGGADAGRFGPILLAAVFFGITASVMVAGPILAGTVGVIVGSLYRRGRSAALVGGAGGLLGCVALLAFGVGIPRLLGGPGTDQFYALGSAVGPLLLSAVITALSGAGAAVLGSQNAG